MRPGTYLLVIAPHCVRDAARALTVKNKNKNDSRYLDMNSKNSNWLLALSFWLLAKTPPAPWKYKNGSHGRANCRISERLIFKSRNTERSQSQELRTKGQEPTAAFRQSCLSDCTGSSLAARDAGYNPADRLTITENTSAAPTNQDGTTQKFSGRMSCRCR